MIKVHVSKSIWIGENAYMYLNRIQRQQRGCKPLTEKSEKRLWGRINKWDDKYQVTDNSFGGGDGTYNGKWWAWDIKTVKAMLDDAGFTYDDGEDVEYINA